MVPHLASIGYEGPVRVVESSPFMECSADPDLSALPILTHFQGRWSVHHLRGGGEPLLWKDQCLCAPADGLRKGQAGGKAGSRQAYPSALFAGSASGQELPVAIAIGVDPLLLMAASTRVPPEKEFSYAAALRGSPVELVRLENGVPAPMPRSSWRDISLHRGRRRDHLWISPALRSGSPGAGDPPDQDDDSRGSDISRAASGGRGTQDAHGGAL